MTYIINPNVLYEVTHNKNSPIIYNGKYCFAVNITTPLAFIKKYLDSFFEQSKKEIVEFRQKPPVKTGW